MVIHKKEVKAVLGPRDWERFDEESRSYQDYREAGREDAERDYYDPPHYEPERSYYDWGWSETKEEDD